MFRANFAGVKMSKALNKLSSAPFIFFRGILGIISRHRVQLHRGRAANYTSVQEWRPSNSRDGGHSCSLPLASRTVNSFSFLVYAEGCFTDFSSHDTSNLEEYLIRTLLRGGTFLGRRDTQDCHNRESDLYTQLKIRNSYFFRLPL